jgi:hypothetical protein
MFTRHEKWRVPRAQAPYRHQPVASLLLLVTVLPETLLLLLHGQLMALALLSTGHGQMIL